MTGRLRGEGLKDGRLRRPRASPLRGKPQTALDRHPNCPQSGKPSASFLLLASPRRGEGKRAKGRQSDGEASSLPLAFAGQGRCQCKPSAIGRRSLQPSGGRPPPLRGASFFLAKPDVTRAKGRQSLAIAGEAIAPRKEASTNFVGPGHSVDS